MLHVKEADGVDSRFKGQNENVLHLVYCTCISF